MTSDEIKRLKLLISKVYEYYGRQISDAALEMQAEDLADLQWESVYLAMKEYRRSPLNKFPPLPAQIRGMLVESKDPKSQAQLTVSKIFEAISRIGPYEPAKVRGYVGPIGWEIIQREGGWSFICETLTTDQMSIHRAQWRQLAEVLHERGERTELTSKASEALENLGTIVPLDFLRRF